MTIKNIVKALLLTLGVNLLVMLGLVLALVYQVASHSAGTGGMAAVGGGVGWLWVSIILLAEVALVVGLFVWLRGRRGQGSAL